MFPESPDRTLYDDTKRKWFLSNWGRTRCNRSAQGLKMDNCTSFKILTHIAPCHIRNKRELHVCMQMYFETWNYMFFEALTRAYKLQFFMSVHLGGFAPPPPCPPPPPPNTKKLATLYCPSIQKWLPFFLFLFSLACLSACSAGKRGQFLGENFFFCGGGGGGGGLLSSKF